MNPRSLSLALALCALGAGSAPGRVIQRSFTSELDLRSDSFEVTGENDGHSSSENMPGYGRKETHLLEAVDTLADEDDPPSDFTRLYKTVGGTLERVGTKEPQEKTVTAGLEGKSVRFERDATGKYERSCEDADVRKGQLERLRADLSLRALLPGADAGESYEIPSDAFGRLLAPLGDIGARKNRKQGNAPKRGLNLSPACLTEPLERFFAGVEGSATAKLEEPSDDEEFPRSAALEFELTSSFDGANSLLIGQEAETEDTVEISYRGKGKLEWNPESGKVRVSLEGDLRVEENFKVSVEHEGKAGAIGGKVLCSGTLKLEGREERE